MTTYRYDFTIANTGQPLTYPMDTTGSSESDSHNTTYMSNTNLYFKQGDTIQVRHTHPLGNNINYTGPDVHGANPDPTVTTSQSGTPSATTASRTLTWSGTFSEGGASASDYFTQWFFFAPDAAGDNTYSTKIVFRKVGYTGFTCGVGAATDGTVTQGEDITFRVASLPGLATWSSSTTNADRIYVSIFTSSNALVDPTTYTSGDAWDNSSSSIGSFTTADKSVDLTVGSNFPPGTYTAWLTHYNNATRMNNFDTYVVGNRYYGSAMRMGSINFTVSTSSGGGGSNPAAFSFTDQGPSGITGGTTYASNTVTLSGMSQASTVTAMTSSAPASSATAYQIGGAGSWYNVNSPGHGTIAVPANTTIRLKRPASTTAGGTVTMNVTVGTTTSGTWTITTPSASNANPDDFAFTNVTGSPPTTTNTSSTDLTGMDVASTVTQLTSGFTATADGTAVSLNSAVPQNATIVLSTTSNATYDAYVEGTITVGTTTSTPWRVTTMSAPTGGGGTSGSSGGANYGIAVLKPGGSTTQLFNPNMRIASVVKKGTSSIPTNTTVVNGYKYSSYVTGVENLDETNDVSVLFQVVGANNTSPQLFDVDYDMAGNRFRFKLYSSSTSQGATAIYWQVVRY
jgi:hypothetical protein